MGECLIDVAELERLTGGLPELRHAALSLFVEHAPRQIAQLSDPSITVVAAAAHTALGSARTIAATPLAATLERLVRACRAGNQDEVSSLSVDAMSLGDRTQHAARSLLGNVV